MREMAGEKDDPFCNAPPKLASRRYTFHMLVLAPIYQIHAAPSVSRAKTFRRNIVHLGPVSGLIDIANYETINAKSTYSD